jgi:hypothetical protein
VSREQRDAEKDLGCRSPPGMAVMSWLHALVAAALGAGLDRGEIATRVHTLNALHAAHLDLDGAPSVLESRARC